MNLNAAPRPVLQALLQDISGTNFHVSPLPAGNPLPYTITSDMAAAIAGEIILRRPYTSWQAFFSALDAMVPGIISGPSLCPYYQGGNQAGADLIKANFDPNTDLNKQCADQLMWRWLDKSDLKVSSTEGSLYPTGTFRVAATGRLLGPNGRLLAEAGLSVTVEAFSLLRQTTQKDFVGPRTLSDQPRYLSLNTDPDPFHRTTGASADIAWWGGTPPGQGVAVMTYPCPVPALPGKAADFDGCIGLATIETPSSQPSGGTLKFLHHFDDGWDADFPVTAGRQSGPNDSCLQTDVAASVWPDSSLPGPQNEPNTICPDGMHAQYQRCPAYSADVIPKVGLASHGVLQYWVKPGLSATSHRRQLHFSCARLVPFSSPLKSQVLMVGTKDCVSLWGMMVEIRVSTPAPGAERHSTPGRYDGISFPRPIRQPGLRWHLVSAFWDMNEAALGEDVNLLEKGARTDGKYTYLNYTDNVGYLWTSDVEDLTPPGSLMVLGAPNYTGQLGSSCETNMKESNQVIDELAIYDFTDTAIFALDKRDGWFLGRFKDGRYCKGDGSFLSVPLEPEPGARLLGVHWTAYLPSENRQEPRVVGMHPEAASLPRSQDPYVTGAGGVCRLKVEAALVDATDPSILIQNLQNGARLNQGLGTFRYRITFRNDFTATELLDNPILESAFLDDITFLCQRAGGPRVLTWSAGK